MDGLTCVRKIRELQSDGSFTRPVPVIAVTANARLEQVKNAKDMGMVLTSSFTRQRPWLTGFRTTLLRNHSGSRI